MAKVLDRPILADQNISREVVGRLRDWGFDVTHVGELGLGAASDREILRTAFEEGRVVLTHDSDFGALALRDEQPFVGIVFLRPGNIASSAVLELIRVVRDLSADVESPFLVVAERRGGVARIRLRSLDFSTSH